MSKVYHSKNGKVARHATVMVVSINNWPLVIGPMLLLSPSRWPHVFNSFLNNGIFQVIPVGDDTYLLANQLMIGLIPILLLKVSLKTRMKKHLINFVRNVFFAKLC